MIKELCLDYFRCLRNIFRFKWRMSKSDFCRFMTVHFVICLLAIISMRVTFTESALGFYVLLLLVLIIIPYFAVAHRLQDMGKSGFRLLTYILVAAIVFFLCYMLFYTNLAQRLVHPFSVWCPVDESPCVPVPLVFPRVLFLLIGVFLSRRWFLPDGEKTANKFGEPHEDEQNKVNKWFLVLAVLLITFVLFFPWCASWEAVIRYYGYY